ncbi:MAG: hypothetical protein IT235_02530 [Bacteroidia bacterium]|nr:hypothetical protein [Bacteroidia bacterium]
MGFAYAQGMIMQLQIAKLKLGRYYIIAPENACSGAINTSDFEEVWQYGSDEVNDSRYDQDGVAPQCKVRGLPDPSRVYIPSGEKKGFLESHYIENYGWVFKRIQKGDRGDVKTRK